MTDASFHSPATVLQTSTAPAEVALVTDFARARRILLSNEYRPVELGVHLRSVQEGSGKDFSSLLDLCDRALIFQSGEAHLRLRRLLMPFFGALAMEVWRPAVHEAVHLCLDGLEGNEHVDLLEDFADPLFAATVPRVLGVRVRNPQHLLELIATARHFVEPLLSPRAMLAVQDAFKEILALIRDSLADPAPEGPRPFLHTLEARGGPVAENQDLVVLLASLLVAAHTTSETLCFVLWRLLRATPADRRAAADPVWVEARLETLLRLHPSTLHVGRSAPEGAEGCPVGGQGQVWIHVPSVNRDPEVFPETLADEGSLEQAAGGSGRHLSFGAGAHKCPGAALARLTLQVAIPGLMARFPGIKLRESEIRWTNSAMIRMPSSLPCALT